MFAIVAPDSKFVNGDFSVTKQFKKLKIPHNTLINLRILNMSFHSLQNTHYTVFCTLATDLKYVILVCSADTIIQKTDTACLILATQEASKVYCHTAPH